jgi:hypothetical protein
MDHDYELAAYDRNAELVVPKDRLLKPDTYHYKIHPSAAALEQQKAAEKSKKGAAKEE